MRVAASGVNRPDVLQRKGLYPVPPGASDLPGPRDRRRDRRRRCRRRWPPRASSIGDRVCALVAGGGYAELCTAPVGQCLPVPEGLTDIEAASLPETFFTVWSNVFDRGRLQAGETLLVQGGTSGIGVTAIQLGKAFGATVIVDRRQRRQVRRLRRARRRPRDQLPDAGLRRRGASASPAGAASTWCSTWWRATMSRASCSAWPRTAALVIIAVQGGIEGADRRRRGAAPASDDHRLDAAAAAGRVQGRDRRARCASTSGR